MLNKELSQVELQLIHFDFITYTNILLAGILFLLVFCQTVPHIQ